MNPTDAFNHLLKILPSQKFLQKEGIGNEVPFFIYPFDVKDSNEVYKNKTILFNRLKEEENVKILDINLYDFLFQYLTKERVLDHFFKTEASLTKREFSDQLKSILNLEKKFFPQMLASMEETQFDILFISGVGEVYPVIRTHKFLSILQVYNLQKPTVLYFPGEYTFDMEKGYNLNLFGKQISDSYYRAFNLLTYKI